MAGRIDHLAVDLAGTFIAALGNHTIEVTDLRAGRVVHTIRGLDEPQGLSYWPEQGTFFTADGGVMPAR